MVAKGKGLAINPTIGEVCAPVDCKVSAVFPTKHAIGITTMAGTEILIHVGMNTVSLKGKYFNTLVKEGDLVKKGEVLLKFDKEKIKEAGFELVTPIIITHTSKKIEMFETDKESVEKDDLLLALVH